MLTVNFRINSHQLSTISLHGINAIKFLRQFVVNKTVVRIVKLHQNL